MVVSGCSVAREFHLHGSSPTQMVEKPLQVEGKKQGLFSLSLSLSLFLSSFLSSSLLFERQIGALDS